ncbi:polysaccharide deacetylase family protein [Winogradskyella haliclonae]|uniref:Polysaccharide deacetylase n=1 Tax=Winogradskyella haliclonae TaxID=2048558 RepID=A0ABQ2BXN3_9FLAO|nr:polysaccharide deacetylase family protein [Winogradskyella haliclonae]GGI56542.1 polysaccharide deacetylase [Winogradskyella haliclonae]
MKLIPAKTPGFVKSLFPNFIWNIDTNKKELYLTFDDGPTPEITLWVLEQLKAFSAKATFFCIGSNVDKYPEILKAILEDNHSIGNHTFNHLKGWKHKTKDYLTDVELAQKTIDKTPSSGSKLFRPPYGKFKTKQAKQLQKLGYNIVMWDVLSFDWDASVSKEDCLNNILNSVKEGSIVVLHDSVKAEQNLKGVLPKVLEYYSNRGFTFKALS